MKIVLLTVLVAAFLVSGLAQNPTGNLGSKSLPPQDPQKTQQPAGETVDVVRVETDLVTTLFTAVDNDRQFVTGLRAEDVRIKEDGVEQEITLFERETDRPLTIVILVDTSRSQERTLPDEQYAAKKFVEAVVRPDRDTIAVVSFTGKPKVELSLSNKVAAINRAIDQMKVEIPPGGCDAELPVDEDARCWTSIWDSVIASARGLLATSPKGNRRAIILLSDGDDTSSRATREHAIEKAVASDIVIYSIGLGDPENYSLEKGTLRKLAEKTGGRAFFPLGDEDLADAFAQIQSEMRSQYIIGYNPKNRARDGSYRKVKLEIVNPEWRKRKLHLLYREGYYARKA